MALGSKALRVSTLIQERRLDEALKVSTSYIEENPDDEQGWICLGSVLKKGLDFEKALECYIRAAEINPRAYQALLGKALCYALVGKVSEGLTAVNTFLEICPENSHGVNLRNRLEARLRIEPSIGSGLPIQMKSDVQRNAQGPVHEREPEERANPPQAMMKTNVTSPRLVHDVIDHLEMEKNSLLIAAPKVFCLRATITVLQTLVGMYDMDGVLVCVGTNPRIFQKALERQASVLQRTCLLELLTDAPYPAPAKGIIECPIFDLERLTGAIMEGLQQKAEECSGEDHFVMVDDITALKYYHEKDALSNFFEIFGELLDDAGVVNIGIGSREYLGPFVRWPEPAYGSRINCNKSWFSISNDRR